MNLFQFFGGKKDAAAAAPKARRNLNMGALARMFAAGEVGRLTGDWGTTPLPADAIIKKNQRNLVARSREQAMNNDYAKSFLRIISQNIVGPRGVTLQAQARDANGKLDQVACQAIELEFARWGRKENCDVTGQKSWREFQRAVVRSAGVNGEFFLRKVYGKDAGAYGFALQELDPQRCPIDLNENQLQGGRFIRFGIEFNQYGKPLAYYFDIERTGTHTDDAYTIGGKDFQRIPADEIIHGFLPDMPGQKRGLPWMATSLFRMRQLNGLEDAAIVNARVGAAKMGFVEYEAGYGPESDDEPVEIDVEAGTFHELPQGAKLSTFDPQYPSGEYAGMVKVALRGIASGLGVAYTSLANDLEGVNFSSIRQGTLDEREHYKELQEWLIESLHEIVFAEWLPRALLAGLIKTPNGRPLAAAKLDKYAQVTWQARRWAWIDPRADADAAVTSKNNLLKAPGAIIREDGQDPAAVYREIAADIDAMKAAGIPDKFIELAMGMKLAPPPAPTKPAKEN